MNKRKVGDFYEIQACEYLHTIGYEIVKKNFRFKNEEIDLIALDKKTLVFVEVKYRAKTLFNPFNSINHKKIKYLRSCANHFIETNKDFQRHYARFDIVVFKSTAKGELSIDHLKNAF